VGFDLIPFLHVAKQIGKVAKEAANNMPQTDQFVRFFGWFTDVERSFLIAKIELSIWNPCAKRATLFANNCK
jgi:hypothetical protein